MCISLKTYLRRLRGSREARAAEDNTAERCADVLIHMRQPIPRQKLFRIKGGRSDGALKIGDLLIASKVPKASDLAQSQDRPRKRFTAAAFGLPFGRAKGNVYYLGIRVSARRACGPRSSRTAILQNLSSAAAGVAPKVRAAEDNTAERCADACVSIMKTYFRAAPPTLYREGEIPTRCLKYLPKKDCDTKLSRSDTS